MAEHTLAQVERRLDHHRQLQEARLVECTDGFHRRLARLVEKLDESIASLVDRRLANIWDHVLAATDERLEEALSEATASVRAEAVAHNKDLNAAQAQRMQRFHEEMSIHRDEEDTRRQMFEARLGAMDAKCRETAEELDGLEKRFRALDKTSIEDERCFSPAPVRGGPPFRMPNLAKARLAAFIERGQKQACLLTAVFKRSDPGCRGFASKEALLAAMLEQPDLAKCFELPKEVSHGESASAKFTALLEAAAPGGRNVDLTDLLPYHLAPGTENPRVA